MFPYIKHIKCVLPILCKCMLAISLFHIRATFPELSIAGIQPVVFLEQNTHTHKHNKKYTSQNTQRTNSAQSALSRFAICPIFAGQPLGLLCFTRRASCVVPHTHSDYIFSRAPKQLVAQSVDDVGQPSKFALCLPITLRNVQ